ncbi:MAG: autotransporter outer membrane beta-barrel domain-containing protein [Alphaproteobacteria bacterium]|nr:autotransporter outer membrane beta-barrel domain-containing protein [Alphaproteobacteria bacterium]
MSKRILMLSAATAALLAGQAFADTDVTKSTSTALTTGTLPTGAFGTGNAGNVTVESGGAISISKGPVTSGTTTINTGAITINSDNFVYSLGNITNDKTTGAAGILVNMTNNPDPISAANTANTSGYGIELGNASSLNLTGSGTGKHGIWLNNTDTTTTNTYTFTGPIKMENGSTLTIDGDNSQGISIDPRSTLVGDLSLGGTIQVVQTTSTSTTLSNLYGVLSQGTIQGNLSVLSGGGAITVTGAGGQGISIQGYGIKGGALTIGGSVTTIGFTGYNNNLTLSTSATNHPEGGTALAVAASVDNGIAILGPGFSGDTSVAAASVSTQGTSATVYISPGLNSSVTTQTAPLMIGVYSLNGAADANDPGFSFYNRGSITAQPVDPNVLASDAHSAIAMHIVGASAFSTTLTGGFFNSGAITAASSSVGSVAPSTSSTAVLLDSYTSLDNATFATTGSGSTTAGQWTDASLAAKHAYVSVVNPGDQAAFVNSNATGSGTISASVSGTRGGIANALVIAANSSVPSIINSGKIVATTTATDATLNGSLASGGNPVAAYAIEDLSGTLTSIYNTGTISASAGVGTSSSSTLTALDNNAQVADAIVLAGNTATPSGSGVTITDQATSTAAATITGNIIYGTGDKQILNINGTGPNTLATVVGDVSFGSTGANAIGDQLNIGAYGYLNGKVTAGSGPGVAVNVASNGLLLLQNDTTSLNANGVTVAANGGLSLGVSQSLTSTGVIDSSGPVNIAANAKLGVAYNSFVPQGTHDFVLITAPHGQLTVDPNTISLANTALTSNVSSGGSLPYLFESAQLQTNPGTSSDELLLHVVPKTATQLGLTGYAAQMFPYANVGLANDDTLGAAMVNGIHNAAEAQAAYNSFAPNVTGGTRAIVISITDQATGVVAARQRQLRLYGKTEGGTTLWGDEFAQMIKDPGRGPLQADGTRTQSGFKDHGFGFSLGMDGGTPKYGWYGGAFTFYTGDVGELTRDSHTNEQWYILSGYTAWRGKGLFFDSKIDAGYGHFNSKRYISLTTGTGGTGATYTREADNNHPGTMVSGGFSTGVMYNYGATTFMPQISVDGLLMREEGYTEHNPGTTVVCAGTATVCDAFDLKVQPYYAKSLRMFLGADVRYDIDLWDFYLQPEARAGYRYDFFNDPVKLKAAFAYADTTGATPAPGTQFPITGPDPSQGNWVVGGSLAASSDAWSLGFNFDFVKGTNGVFEQVGTVSLLGRI